MENPNQTPVTAAQASLVTHDQFSRRRFLGLGTAVLSIAGIAPSILAASQGKPDRSSSTPGPSNPSLDAENTDAAFPPGTDAGGYPTFKYPFAFANKRMHDGGWSREVTFRELPISKAMAGVNMRLTAGGVR
jgi:oxalate decarboxylase